MKNVSLFETFGLHPLPVRAHEAWVALRGMSGVPASRFDHTSLSVLAPALSVKTWVGWRRRDRKIPISNLFNHTQTPPSEGWSVRKSQVKDYRGGTLTYDSHNGTDFVIPVGTVVTAPAKGRVLRVSSEFNRGGLKVFIDHGRGLSTTCNHLARSLVNVGDEVRRGQPIALSGYSGLDGFAMFPWSPPHVHFNCWLNGTPVDPFGSGSDEPLWVDGNTPRTPFTDSRAHPIEATTWDARAIDEAIESCTVEAIRAELRAEPSLDRRAMNLMFQRNYYPTRFAAKPPIQTEIFGREARLTLPFRSEDFDGVHIELDPCDRCAHTGEIASIQPCVAPCGAEAAAMAISSRR